MVGDTLKEHVNGKENQQKLHLQTLRHPYQLDLSHDGKTVSLHAKTSTSLRVTFPI